MIANYLTYRTLALLKYSKEPYSSSAYVIGGCKLIANNTVFQNLGKPKFCNPICFKISKDVPYIVGF